MAGDWIKMRGNLWDDPRIASICDETGISEATAIGGLYWLWASADQHSEDGVMHGLTMRSIDRKTGIPGMADALVSVGWLADHPEGVRLTRFDEHNGVSAKKRAQTAKRVSIHTENTKLTQASLAKEQESVSTALAREREEKEKEKKEPKINKPAAPEYSAITELVAVGVDKQVATDWLKIRKGKKAEPNKTGIDAVLKKITEAGMTPDQGIRICCERSWSGFSQAWLENTQNRMAIMGKPINAENSRLGPAGQATAANAKRWMEAQDAEQ